jgi:hypothetical protein
MSERGGIFLMQYFAGTRFDNEGRIRGGVAREGCHCGTGEQRQRSEYTTYNMIWSHWRSCFPLEYFTFKLFEKAAVVIFGAIAGQLYGDSIDYGKFQ